jgi:hypothetical protein
VLGPYAHSNGGAARRAGQTDAAADRQLDFDLVRRGVEQQFGPHARPGRVVIDLIGAPPVTLPILGPAPAAAESPRPQTAGEPAVSGKSGDDFRTVLWRGQVYGFSPTQAKVVAAL